MESKNLDPQVILLRPQSYRRLFAQSLAEPIIDILAQMNDPVIIEVGAGTGRLAEDLIKALSARSVSPTLLHTLKQVLNSGHDNDLASLPLIFRSNGLSSCQPRLFME